MNANGFRKALKQLGMKQTEFADLLDLADRTVRHYANEGVPSMPVEILLGLLLTNKITRQDIEGVKGCHTK